MLHYLLRIEPFTTFHVDLNDGKFDHPDRQVGLVSLPAGYVPASANAKLLIPSCLTVVSVVGNVMDDDP